MWKIVVAMVLSGGVLWLESLLQLGVLPGGWLTYLIGVGLAALCAWKTTKVSQVHWLAVVVLLVGGALLFLGLNQGWAIYAVIAGIGLLAGTLAAMFVGSSGTSHASASGGH